VRGNGETPVPVAAKRSISASSSSVQCANQPFAEPAGLLEKGHGFEPGVPARSSRSAARMQVRMQAAAVLAREPRERAHEFGRV
jgi:hypothetical protein